MKKNGFVRILSKIQNLKKDTIKLGDLIDSFSQRGFGILLVIPSLCMITPIGAIPGIPFIIGLFIAILSTQILLGIKKIWLPKKLINVNLSIVKLKKFIKYMMPIAKFVDSYTKHRLVWMFNYPSINIIGTINLMLSIITMFIGFIPFLPAITGIIILFFSISLLAKDGIITLIGFGAASFLGTIIYLNVPV